MLSLHPSSSTFLYLFNHSFAQIFRVTTCRIRWFNSMVCPSKCWLKSFLWSILINQDTYKQSQAVSSTRIENFRCTWSGFLQCVPAVEGPFLLLAQVGAVLQQPMGDPALADAWKAARHRITTECFASGPSPICRQPLEEFKRHKGIQEGKMFSLSLALNLFLLQSLVSYATWSQ